MQRKVYSSKNFFVTNIQTNDQKGHAHISKILKSSERIVSIEKVEFAEMRGTDVRQS